MLNSIPFWCRVALLLLLMAVVASIDWYRHGQRATRPREYGFVVLSGLVGGVFGFLNDLITSSISPEYFIYGKGLAAGDGLTWRAGELGIKAGLAAGAIAGAVCVYGATRRCARPALSFRTLLGFLWRPVALAPATAILLAVACSGFDPLGFSAELDGVLDPHETRWFLTVWWVHLGLYVGLAASVGWIVVDIIRKRRATPGSDV